MLVFNEIIRNIEIIQTNLLTIHQGNFFSAKNTCLMKLLMEHHIPVLSKPQPEWTVRSETE